MGSPAARGRAAAPAVTCAGRYHTAAARYLAPGRRAHLVAREAGLRPHASPPALAAMLSPYARPEDRRRALARPAPGRQHPRAVRRGRHAPVHRPLPQGSHRRARRGAAPRRPRPRASTCSELEERRAAILKRIEEQGKLDDAAARRASTRADTKQALEDLYLPYKPKRRTRATIARERGLEPLAELLWAGDADDAGARGARPRRTSTRRRRCPTSTTRSPARATSSPSASPRTPTLRGRVRDAHARARASCSRARVTGKEKRGLEVPGLLRLLASRSASIPSHRVLAIRRGEAEEFLVVDDRRAGRTRSSRGSTRDVVGAAPRAPAQLALVGAGRVQAAARARRSRSSCASSSRRAPTRRRSRSSARTSSSCCSPAGRRARRLGLDPGFRTGVKVAVVSRTGALRRTPTRCTCTRRTASPASLLRARRAARRGARSRSATARRRARPRRSCARRCASWPATPPQVVVVNEAGASVYSASRRRARGAARPRRLAARRRVDRAPAAGSARRAGEDRSQVDRRRAVPARRQPAAAQAAPRRRRRELREPRRRRGEHRVGRAAVVRRRASGRRSRRTS